MPTGAPPTICRSARFILRQSAAEGAAETVARESRSWLDTGHDAGQNFIYVHLNRVIKKYDLDMFYILVPAMAAQRLWGTYTRRHWTESTRRHQDEAGMKKLFKQFSFPGGISSHVRLRRLGQFTKGELGYSLSHAFGAAFDNPDLIVAASR